MSSVWFNRNTCKLNVQFVLLEWLPSSVAVQVAAMRGNWEEVRFEQRGTRPPLQAGFGREILQPRNTRRNGIEERSDPASARSGENRRTG